MGRRRLCRDDCGRAGRDDRRRRSRKVPLTQRGTDVAPARRAGDAHAALAYARALPGVDARRIGIMGGSHGGTTTLNAMMAPKGDAGPLVDEKRNGFAAGVALYPRCVADVYRPVAPVLILIGEKDDRTPAEPCRKLAETSGIHVAAAFFDRHLGSTKER